MNIFEKDDIQFFKNGTKYYCKYKDVVDEVDQYYIEDLKKQLHSLSPNIIKFKGFSDIEINEIIKYLYGENKKFKVKYQNDVLFFKNSDKYYYKYNNIVNVVDNLSINILKSKLLLPFKIEFRDYTIKEIKKIIPLLCEKGIDFKINKKVNEKNNYIVDFTKENQIIYAYKVKNISMLYGRTNNANPYIIRTINGNKILIEIAKFDAKNKYDEYYFLSEDLSEEEKIFFRSCYTKIECNSIYKINSLPNNKTKKIRKIIKK